MSRSAITLGLLSAAALVAAQEGTTRRPEARSPNLKLDHAIHAIDKLYLVSFDFYFDGGSLVFGFATRQSAGEEDAIVEVVLPMPKSLSAQRIGWSGEGAQPVLASPHRGMNRYALVTKADPDYARFIRLIREAGIRKLNEHTTTKELMHALMIVKAAVLKGQPPEAWGPGAFPETYGEDAIDTAKDDDPFDFGLDF